MQIEDNTTPIQTNVVEETNKQEESIPDKPIQFLLTEEERNALQKLLPSGYRFEIDRKKIIEEARPAKMMEFIKNRDDFGLSRNRKQANNLEKLQRDCPEPFKKCYKVLIELKRNENIGPFLIPVDPIGLGIPTYFDIIKKPMDLGTVEKKLRDKTYDYVDEVYDDIQLVWDNAITFNPVGSQINEMATKLNNIFNEMIAKERRHKQEIEELINSNKDRLHRLEKEFGFIDDSIKKEDKLYDDQFKHRLIDLINSLSPEYQFGVWNIIKETNDDDTDSEIKIDLSSLSDEKLAKLDLFVSNISYQLASKANKKRKESIGEQGITKVKLFVPPIKQEEQSKEQVPDTNI